MRTCIVCHGTGNLWGTPRLNVEGGLLSSNPPKASLSDKDALDSNNGLNVPCWRCVGKGSVPDEMQDAGEQI